MNDPIVLESKKKGKGGYGSVSGKPPRPVRQRTVKVDSAEVQGRGSYVIIKKITLGEADEYRRHAEDEPVIPENLSDAEAKLIRREFYEDKEAKARQLMTQYIIEWNWVDDDGNDLPQPLNNPDAIALLTTDEFKWLGEAMRLTGDPNQKKPKTSN